MQVSARVQYGCLAMLELAARYEEGRPVSLREIVNKHAIPQPFLVQILQSLRAAGLVTSARGSSGGYRLSNDPNLISILDIASSIACMESPSHGCESEGSNGQQEAVRRVFTEADEAGRRVLASTSLADLMTASAQLPDTMFYI